jgi:hypothetical protein
MPYKKKERDAKYLKICEYYFEKRHTYPEIQQLLGANGKTIKTALEWYRKQDHEDEGLNKRIKSLKFYEDMIQKMMLELENSDKTEKASEKLTNNERRQLERNLLAYQQKKDELEGIFDGPVGDQKITINFVEKVIKKKPTKKK